MSSPCSRCGRTTWYGSYICAWCGTTFPRPNKRARTWSTIRGALLGVLVIVLTIACIRLPTSRLPAIAVTAVFWSLLIWESASLFSPRVGARMARLGIILSIVSIGCFVAIPLIIV